MLLGPSALLYFTFFLLFYVSHFSLVSPKSPFFEGKMSLNSLFFLIVKEKIPTNELMSIDSTVLLTHSILITYPYIYVYVSMTLGPQMAFLNAVRIFICDCDLFVFLTTVSPAATSVLILASRPQLQGGQKR